LPDKTARKDTSRLQVLQFICFQLSLLCKTSHINDGILEFDVDVKEKVNYDFQLHVQI